MIRIFRSFLWGYIAVNKRAGFSNPVKSYVLESCSNIFFPVIINFSFCKWWKFTSHCLSDLIWAFSQGSASIKATYRQLSITDLGSVVWYCFSQTIGKLFGNLYNNHLEIFSAAFDIRLPMEKEMKVLSWHSVKKAGNSAHFFVGLQNRKAFMSYKYQLMIDILHYVIFDWATQTLKYEPRNFYFSSNLDLFSTELSEHQVW